MNSMKWFNHKYLIQNLKKSKNVLAFFLVIVPLISVLNLIITSQNNQDFVNLTINNVSIVTILGMYVIPIVVSITLFGFVFKRQSSDFICSMPLNRSTIFVTNTIGGIILLSLMILITTALILITTAFMPNLIISKTMMVDFFFIWIVAYIFVFTVANLAATLCGNIITQIALTALILFLPSFLIHSYQGFTEYQTAEIKCSEKACQPTKYNCFDNKKCLTNQEHGIYTNTISYNQTNSFTLPYQYASSIYSQYYSYDISKGQLLKMFILSILYFTLGLYLFRKKKMEVTETSFNNPNIHNLVKSLTIIPMITFAATCLHDKETGLGIFVIVITLVYFFIFDLITKKQITKIGLSLIYFIITTTLVIGYYYAFTKNGLKPNTIITTKDIKAISINYPNDHLDTSNIYLDNQELKNIIVKGLVSNSDYAVDSKRLNIIIKLQNGKKYRMDINNIPITDYEKIQAIAYNNEKFNIAFRNIDFKNVYAITANSLVINPNKNKEIMDMIKKGLENINIAKYNELNQGFQLTLYAYKNHHLVQYHINSAINPKLTRYISKYTNDKLKKEVLNKKPNIDEIENIYIYQKNNDNMMTDYLINHSYTEIYKFIQKNINKTCDIKKEYIEINLSYKGKTYIFYTNNIEGFNKILNKKTNQLKNTTQYIDTLKSYQEEENENNS